MNKKVFLYMMLSSLLILITYKDVTAKDGLLFAEPQKITSGEVSAAIPSMPKVQPQKTVKKEQQQQQQQQQQKKYIATKPVQEKNYNNNVHAWLKDMVGIALEHGPEVRSSLSEMTASSWGVKQVKGQNYPQVNVTGSAPLGSSGNQYGKGINDSSSSVVVTTKVFDWGKLSADLAQAKEELNSASLQVKEVREQIASNTINELLNLSRYSESIKLAEKYVGRMDELVTMLSGIANADKGRVSELVQARARLLSAQAEKERLVHLYDSTKIKLYRLLGREPVLLTTVLWRNNFIQLNTALNAIEEHPTLKRSEAEVRATEARAESTKLSAYPKVNWVVQKSISGGGSYDDNNWYTGLNVEWGLFSGGSNRAAHQAAIAKYRSAKDKREISRFEIEYQIRNMAEIRDSSFIRAESYEKLSKESDRVRNMFYRQWYHLGSRTLLDVLTAESEYFNNTVSAVNNRYDALISNISIMYSSGILLKWLVNPAYGVK